MIDYYELLDEYVEGKLDPTVRRQFEIELNKSQDLQIALENYILAKEISQSMIELSVREQISNLKNKKNNLLIFVRIAAGLLVLFSVGLLFKLYHDSINKKSEQIFASLYNPPVLSASRSGTIALTTLDSAIFLFDHRDYESSKKLFQEIIKIDKESAISIKYLAHIAINEKDYYTAEKYFTELSKSPDTKYHLEAQYNLMTLSIRKNDKASAKQFYQNHFKDKGIIGEKEAEILKDWLE